MYSTISLAAYRQAAAAAQNVNGEHQARVLFPPPAGPNSAYLVLQEDAEEEDAKDEDVCCWGCCDYNRVRELPFPQDKCLTILYSSGSGQNQRTEQDRVYFIPVLGQSISSNCYYVVRAEGNHKGGKNASLRAQLPPFDFPIFQERPYVVVVGEWYCPFIFIKEVGTGLDDPKTQLMDSPFYKMELHKYWEEIHSVQVQAGEKDVSVNKTVRLEEGLLFGEEATEESRDEDGSVWFKGSGKQYGKTNGVRISWPIIAKMKEDHGRNRSEQGGGEVRVEKSFSGTASATKFACYVVVEKYVLKRMEGGIVLTYSFRNCNHIQGKWE
ncbi:hypothetical protein KI387_039388 [Taxus chinensis]|uniref:Uncharacterized protein n=1 Tax=Taxus chinensis TaxID=29808 RepID=A0AA38C8L2_TAXCH|nr:hypothetical protein KI387_039388 [Taxus chinensis]